MTEEVTQQYYGIRTNIGLAEWDNAAASGLMLPFTHIAIGDGNGEPVVPDQTRATLVHEVHRLPITSITADPEQPGLLKFECVILPSIGGWVIRELGLIGGNGGGNKLLAISNFPATPKPLLGEGVGSDMRITMNLIVSNTAVVQLIMDPTVVIATQQAIINAVAAHEAKSSPHPQYILESKRGAANGVASLDPGGLVPLSQLPSALATDTEVSAAISAHLAASNPHPEYATDADLAAHVAASDPHPQYATDADLAAAINGQSKKRLFSREIWRT